MSGTFDPRSVPRFRDRYITYYYKSRRAKQAGLEQRISKRFAKTAFATAIGVLICYLGARLDNQPKGAESGPT